MMEFLGFMFSGFWVFVGMMLFISLVLTNLVKLFSYIIYGPKGHWKRKKTNKDKDYIEDAVSVNYEEVD